LFTSTSRIAVLGAAVLASACTTILGIDGDYTGTRSASSNSGGKGADTGGKSSGEGTGGTTLTDAGASGGRLHGGAGGTGATTVVVDAAAGKPTNGSGGDAPLGSGGAPATGGHAGSGGMPGNGGTTGNGGTSADGGKGAAAGAGGGTSGGAGGQAPDAGMHLCPSGTFTGNYSGTDRPTTGGTVSKAPISGTMTLHLVVSGQSITVTGTVVDPLSASDGGLNGMIRGSIDCSTGKGSASFLNTEVTTVIPPIIAPIDGTLDITVGTSGALDGGFSIHESANPIATGSGTWSATRSGS
jgi:hypothetical protein